MSCCRTLVYDLDSELPFPTYFHKYVTETFRTDAILNPEYHRQFRVVPAASFLNTFASDRRHMRKADMPAVLDNVNIVDYNIQRGPLLQLETTCLNA